MENDQMVVQRLRAAPRSVIPTEKRTIPLDYSPDSIWMRIGLVNGRGGLARAAYRFKDDSTELYGVSFDMTAGTPDIADVIGAICTQLQPPIDKLAGISAGYLEGREGVIGTTRLNASDEKCVLYVDDEMRDFGELMGYLLGSEYQLMRVGEQYGGPHITERAIDKLVWGENNKQPGLVILDIGLDGGGSKTGIELLRRIRGGKGLLSIVRYAPIIMCSARSMRTEPGIAQEAISLGANAYVEKPFDINKLLGAVNDNYHKPFNPREN